MPYTQQEEDIEAIRRRWSCLSSNDIDLTDGQRQIVTDFEVLFSAYDELVSSASDELLDALNECEKLSYTVGDLENTIEDLKEDARKLAEENAELETQVHDLIDKIDALES